MSSKFAHLAIKIDTTDGCGDICMCGANNGHCKTNKKAWEIYRHLVEHFNLGYDDVVFVGQTPGPSD